jgi:flagellar assembly factor FliW
MEIQTTRFGEIEVDDNLCFEMVDPILGYDDEREFVLIEHRANSSFRWLQSTKTPALAFVVTVAGFFGIDYSFELQDEIQDKLELVDADDILALNIVVIPTENPRASTINLLAPLIFNVKNKKGAQVVLSGTKFSVDYPLFEKEAIC